MQNNIVNSLTSTLMLFRSNGPNGFCFYLKALRTAFKIHCQKHFLAAKMAVKTTRPILLWFCLLKALLLENSVETTTKLIEVFFLLTTCTFHA